MDAKTNLTIDKQMRGGRPCRGFAWFALLFRIRLTVRQPPWPRPYLASTKSIDTNRVLLFRFQFGFCELPLPKRLSLYPAIADGIRCNLRPPCIRRWQSRFRPFRPTFPRRLPAYLGGRWQSPKAVSKRFKPSLPKWFVRLRPRVRVRFVPGKNNHA